MTTPTIRCAIYTRKSTEEGLEQEFNSLDAQRESSEAYIASQKGNGWVCLPDRYDDGGYTGGNLDRPAARRLLADAEAGRFDCIVVYKVDRLSRSLMDFARIVEMLERNKISFVSITQHFDTTTSMGRLTLNILLSFAQFEREIISERTRDKIAAARRKGKWIGGIPILGYDVDPQGNRLVINKNESIKVNQIYELYLEYQAMLPVAKELNRRGWRTKVWVTKKGRERGGLPFDKNNLFRVLTNIIYHGKLRYKEEIHEGEHEAIISEQLWQQTQELLRRNGRSGGKLVRNKYGALLKGLLRCESCGCAMTQYGLPSDWKFWQRYDRAYLEACSALAVLALDGWQESEGVSNEVKAANELGMPFWSIEPESVGVTAKPEITSTETIGAEEESLWTS